MAANIPYAITTSIMKKLLGNPFNAFIGGAILMEYGAAKRFTSQVIKNPMVLKWRMWFDLEYARIVSRNNFSPPPKVDSALLVIRRKKDCRIPYKYHENFFALAEYALKDPELSVSEALKGVFTAPQLKHLVKKLGVSRDDAICSLKESQWQLAFHTMTKYVQQVYWPKARKRKR